MEEGRLVKQVYKVSRTMCQTKNKANWASKIRDMLDRYNLKYLWKDETKLLNLDGHGNKEAKTKQDHLRFIRSFLTGR